MLFEWTRHISDPKEKEEFENTVRNSNQVLDRLNQILDEKEATITRSEITSDSYKDSSWAYKQAHLNGNHEMIHWLRKILTLDNRN